MKKYLVRFTTKSGDYDKAWCDAVSEDDAIQTIKDDYWNIAHINLVEEL